MQTKLLQTITNTSIKDWNRLLMSKVSANEMEIVDIPKYDEKSTLTGYASYLANHFSKNQHINARKLKGQIFTPYQVAQYMANFVNISKREFSLLDPGAGTGILLAAVCQRFTSEMKEASNIFIKAYENDSTLLPYLHATLNACQQSLKKYGHNLKFEIVTKDFIVENSCYINVSGQIDKLQKKPLFDAVIANPPYFKLNKNSPQSLAMIEFVSGQPNIYALFMALSLNLIKNDGDFVFIIPRSFCSGLYYKKIRSWFVQNTCIKWIHNFESRKKVFDSDEILQENIILHAEKVEKKVCEPIKTSICFDKNFHDYRSIEIPYNNLIFNKNDEFFIRIPTSESELKIIQLIDSWESTFTDIGLKISTGPVVDFRTKENLMFEYDKKELVPLLWMHNLTDIGVNWPQNKNGKENAILVNEKTNKLLLPVDNYVLLKRFTSKEQKRRIYATPFFKRDFKKYPFIGFENHLNYIHCTKRGLSEEEILGLTILLNTKLIDIYFRTLNGNTQVNATEIRTLPLPNMSIIKKLGERYISLKLKGTTELDSMLSSLIEMNSIEGLDCNFNEEYYVKG